MTSDMTAVRRHASGVAWDRSQASLGAVYALPLGGLGVAAACLAARSRLGVIAMTLSLPMIGLRACYS